MMAEYARGFEVGIEAGRAFERERITAALKAEPGEALDLSDPYVRALVALIEKRRKT